jgi:hypothetical protein
MVVRYLSPRMW